jgi:hypothetical protein
MRQRAEIPRPTLAQLRQAAPWLLAVVPERPLPAQNAHGVAPLIIRWGADASSDVLRQSARCTCCGGKGANLQHLSARSSEGLALRLLS